MPMIRRLDEDMHYGYRIRNYFTGDIICERQFETRDEMEAAMKDDLAPDAVLGKVLATFPSDGESEV